MAFNEIKRKKNCIAPEVAFWLACAASVSVRAKFSTLWPRENWGESKTGGRGRGGGRRAPCFPPPSSYFLLSPQFSRGQLIECGKMNGFEQERLLRRLYFGLFFLCRMIELIILRPSSFVILKDLDIFVSLKCSYY